MDQVPAPVVDERLAQTIAEQNDETAINVLRQMESPTNESDLDRYLIRHADVLNQANQLNVKAKVALICKLITHLESEQIQTILEFGQQELTVRQRQVTAPQTTTNRETRLVLKKDYSYQERGLSEPTQYYVYLRRRKPKLDRYIGTLFYIPQGCTLSYFPDSEGRIIFNPPHNVFQLKDSKKTSLVQIVRLVCLEPPPPDYTFTKQQDDSPEIHLRLEYLDPKTYRVLAEKLYSFPFCMYEGGTLDRYRWNVSTIALPAEQVTSQDSIDQCVNASSVPSQPLPSSFKPSQEKTVSDRNATSSISSSKASPVQSSKSQQTTGASSNQPKDKQSKDKQSKDKQSRANRSRASQPKQVATTDSRRVIELPSTPRATFYLTDRQQTAQVLERMQLWVRWSEKAMPQSRWEIVQEKDVFILMNANFKRNILIFSPDQASVTLANSLPVLMKWFYDLSLTVSQSRNQRQYSTSQLKLAHGLFVDMSLPHDNPLTVLKLLFDIEFAETLPS